MRALARKSALIAAMAALVLGAAACGSDAESASGTSGGDGSAAEVDAGLQEAKAVAAKLAANEPLEIEPLSKVPPADYNVAVVTCNINACYPGETTRAAESLGWDVSEETYDLAKGPADFVAAVRRALQSKPDALAILFVYPHETIADELQQAMEDGVVLIDAGSAVDAAPEGFVGCVYCNPSLAGYGVNLAQWAAADDDGAGSGVAVVGDKTIAAHISSGEATTEALEKYMPGSEITQINVSFAKTPQANAQTVVATLQRDPDIKYLLYQTPDLLAGVDQALGAAGLSDKVKVGAPGPSTAEELMAVEQGFPTIWISTGSGSYWWDVVDIFARNLVGDDFSAMPVAPTALVTKENASPELLTPPDYEGSYKKAWGVS